MPAVVAVYVPTRVGSVMTSSYEALASPIANAYIPVTPACEWQPAPEQRSRIGWTLAMKFCLPFFAVVVVPASVPPFVSMSSTPPTQPERKRTCLLYTSDAADE